LVNIADNTILSWKLWQQFLCWMFVIAIFSK
jgi:hypothetical protein